MLDILSGTGTDIWNALGSFATMVDQIKSGWIGPAFILVAAAIGIMLAAKKEIRGAIVAAIVFIIAGIFIYAPNLFQNTATTVGNNASLGWS